MSHLGEMCICVRNTWHQWTTEVSFGSDGRTLPSFVPVSFRSSFTKVDLVPQRSLPELSNSDGGIVVHSCNLIKVINFHFSYTLQSLEIFFVAWLPLAFFNGVCLGCLLLLISWSRMFLA